MIIVTMKTSVKSRFLVCSILLLNIFGIAFAGKDGETKIACVCFDLGGVVLRVKNWRHESNYKLIQSFNISLDGLGEKFKALGSGEFNGRDLECGRCSGEDYLRKVSRIFEIDYDVALAFTMAILSEPYEGVAEIITALKGRGIQTACLSNNDVVHWKRVSDASIYPAVALLDAKVLSFEHGTRKPESEMFTKFEEITGFREAQILFFDDSQENVDAAIKCGWQAVKIDPTQETAPQIREALERFSLL